ncbi:expressed unknown protein [Seminavis robusta]|uniref:Uncharacterized protein n=1 Tax=Seminavis robusta TaxID=568900 RepID=A0A9N8EGS1_9STRA|nr:expressed unknown protein [Seminavis robusta]|eukprot:Sro969_g226220.1 n/a (606) ;mRNA; f:22669-24486
MAFTRRNRKLSKVANSSSRPVWFVALLVGISVLAFMHRFRESTEPQLILASSRAMTTQDVEPPQQQNRNMLRDDAKNEAFNTREDERTVIATLKAELQKAEQAKQDNNNNNYNSNSNSNRADSKKQDNSNNRAVPVRESTKESSLKAAQENKPEENSKGGDDSSSSLSKEELLKDRPVYFMKNGQVNEKDAFSASWIQRTEDFLVMDLRRINICEDAAFKAFKYRRHRLRMTLDWLDFSLEHLSKWWKMLKIFEFQTVFDTAKTRFDNYLAKAATFPMEENPSFIETVAVIAFQQYKDGKQKEQSYQLTKLSLASTMESLRRAGMGRIVVVGRPKGLDPWGEDYLVCQDTFRHLKGLVEGETVANTTLATMVGNMEVAFVEFNETDAKTPHLAKNVPKATLVGLKTALQHSIQKEPLTDQETEFMKQWLGDRQEPTYWRYVYLTEPDSILQTRPSTLKKLKQEVDLGNVLVPHRLQPIPHEDDAPGHPRDFLFLPKDIAPIIELDSIGEGDACCDHHKGPEYKPGQPPMMKGCGNFWYMCDFSRRIPKENRTHDRIRQYPLIKLKQGTEIISLAALEHGRPCLPKKNDVCVPPDLEEYESLRRPS